MSRVKYYHVFGRKTLADGEHVVTIVGKFEQTRKNELVQDVTKVEVKPNQYVDGILTYEVKQLNRKLTLGMSICHPYDTFDEEVGEEIAKKRIENGYNLGSIETSDVTMLTEDAIFAELVTKLNYVLEHIQEYISED